jgi:cytochrome d ubiquinol oxidase subunit I
MSDLLFARSLMAMSLAFHIVFAVVGMGMPVLMLIAEARWLRSRDPVDLELCKRWAKGTAVLFAIGAASGTVLAFELGLLWPGFMDFAGGIIGLPFALEGFAFFAEAIFLGLYLYGWQRLAPRAHLACGALVALAGLASAAFVMCANAWMNAPAGFVLRDGRATDVDPIAAMLNAASLQQGLHMILAAYVATGFAVAGVHAALLLRRRTSAFHRRALGMALALGAACVPLQLVSGDLLARLTARLQPAKFAALEGLYRTQTHAPLTIGGFADDDARETRWALHVPGALSLLAHGRAAAPVTGLEDVPRELWPPTAIVHTAFDVMVACGGALFLAALWVTLLRLRGRSPADLPAGLRALVLLAPLGFLAIEAGWVVTEVGRQPWIIHGVMRTAEAVTPVSGLAVPFGLFAAVYLLLAVILVFLLKRMFLETAPRARRV